MLVFNKQWNVIFIRLLYPSIINIKFNLINSINRTINNKNGKINGKSQMEWNIIAKLLFPSK